MADLHDLAAPYALDALDGDELQSFERHLAKCETCRADVTLFREVAAAAADGAAESPPSGLKERVMDQIDRRVGDNVVRGPWYRGPAVTRLAVAAALVLVVAIGAFVTRDTEPTAADVFAAPDATTLALAGDGIDARFTFSVTEQLGVFESGTLPAVGQDLVYQLWLIDDGGLTSAGIFAPDAGGASSALVGQVRPGVVLGLTVEPAGGSPQPTGEVLLAAEIG